MSSLEKSRSIEQAVADVSELMKEKEWLATVEGYKVRQLVWQ